VAARFDAVGTRIGALDARVGSLESKVDKIGAKLDESHESINSLQSMQKAIIWLLTAGFGSLIALATLAKTLHWI